MSPRPPSSRGPKRSSRPNTPYKPANAPRRPPREREGVGGDQVEGRHAVLELLRAKRRNVKKIFIAENQDASDMLDAIELEAQRQRIPVSIISMSRLDREAKTEGHQGVMALAQPLDTVMLEDLLRVA